jgi:hypothetical protein
MRQPHRGGAVPCWKLCLFSAVLLALPPDRASAASKIQVQEILSAKGAADLGKTEVHVSLLVDDHTDTVLRVHGPGGASSTWHVLFLSDDYLVVPVERSEIVDGPGNLMFDGEVSGDGCVTKDVRFFRKFVNGKVTGFYAIQTTMIYGRPKPRLLYEVFRFERNQGRPRWDYPRFIRVADKRVFVGPCGDKAAFADFVKLIRDN